MSKRLCILLIGIVAVASAAQGFTYVLDDFSTSTINDTTNDGDLYYEDIDANWGSMNRSGDTVDWEIADGQLRRVDCDQSNTRVGTIFRIDLSASGTPEDWYFEFDQLVAGKINDMSIWLGTDDANNQPEDWAYTAKYKDNPPSADIVTEDGWVKIIDQGWEYSAYDEPNRVSINFNAENLAPEDVSGYDLLAVIFENGVNHTPLVFDDMALEGPAGYVPTPGDTNGDDVVDAGDYMALKQNLGAGPGASQAQGDVSDGDGTGQDGYVNLLDLDLMAEALNSGAGGAVPEPATMGLLAVGALALLRRRRT